MSDAVNQTSYNPLPPATPAEWNEAEKRAEALLGQLEKQPVGVGRIIKRRWLNVGTAAVAMFLLVTLPLTIVVVSQQKKLGELRGSARETAELSTGDKNGVVENRKIMPDMYRYLAQKYLPKDTTSPVDLTIKVVKISESNSKISGVAYFKYDQQEKQTYVFSRITGLTTEKGRAPYLWIQKGSEYQLLGEIALTNEPEGITGYYSSYYETSTLMAFDFLVVSYDSPGELKTPQSVVAKVSTTLTGK